jgi:hypothetical protein
VLASANWKATSLSAKSPVGIALQLGPENRTPQPKLLTAVVDRSSPILLFENLITLCAHVSRPCLSMSHRHLSLDREPVASRF